MKDHRESGGLRMLRLAVVVALALFLLINPGAIAGHLDTSPARLERSAKPQVPDGVAIRGVTARDSTGAEDIPIALVGRATGNATGFEGAIFAIRGATTGNAIGQDSAIFGVDGRAFGNASGPGAGIVGTRGRVTGNATGSGSALFGVQGRVTGDFTGQNAFVVGVQGRVDGIPTGPGASVTGVHGVARATSGNATGVVGRSFSTSGHGGFFEATATSGLTHGVTGRTNSPTSNGVFGHAASPTGFTQAVTGHADSTGGRGVVGFATATSGETIGVLGRADSPQGIGIVGQGNNGARAAVLQGRVDINCPATPCVFVNGTGVADLAEDMPVAGRVAPGDVVSLARGQGYGVARAARPYDTRVAGIISAQPRIVLGVRQGKPSAPVALVGVVRAKATAATGSIELGDLLTTSRVPGHLMRCPAPLRCVGAIVGKALEPLERGEKQILVLLWRQ